jgi:hypothetical protein
VPSQTFSTSGTFTVPNDVGNLQCQVWGEVGNAAAGSDLGLTGGGGGGEYAAENSLFVTPGSTLTITIGPAAPATPPS